VDLEFDVESLRIRDLGEDEDYQNFKKQTSSIYEQIKTGDQPATADTDPEVGKITANVQSSKLKDMLAGLKSE